jgi:hypothetical protein
MNKVYLESLDNDALGKVVKNLGATSAGTGSLKRLQTILQAVDPKADIATLTSPLYVLYDLRVVYSHLTGTSTSPLLTAVTTRLGLPAAAPLVDIYAKLLDGLIDTFKGMVKVLETGSLA